MSKEKLKKFRSFCAALLPHELDYLLSISEKHSEEKREVLKNIHLFVNEPSHSLILDPQLDKRKYSRWLSWMKKELNKVNVDLHLDWIMDTHRRILQDDLDSSLEKEIIRHLRNYHASDFYFVRFYELLVEYRHYLLIRMRYTTYDLVHQFIERHQLDYKRSQLINEQLHQASTEIIGSHRSKPQETIQWSHWLRNNFEDKRLDGLNRYMSAIRYIFICVRYQALDDLEQILLALYHFFSHGQNYSRRLLVNFYDNMLLLYDQKKDYARASYYGNLSIKYAHPDTLIYRNNYVNVLIKNEDFHLALRVIEEANFKIRHIRNFHSAIGFIANHIKCLTKTGASKDAVSKGQIYLQAYRDSIMKYRWHRFFTAYLGALMSQEQYEDVMNLIKKLHLNSRELEFQHTVKAKFILNIYYLIAQFKTDHINADAFVERFVSSEFSKGFDSYDKELRELVMSIFESSTKKIMPDGV